MDMILSIAVFLLGAVLASFACVVAERLHTGTSFIRGRSHCNSCGKVLRAHDLVPIISWVLSFGRCRRCQARIPLTYVLFEVVTGLSFLLAFHMLGLTIPLFWFLGALAVLVFIVAYDIRHTVVPHASSAILVILSLLASYTSHSTITSFGWALLTAGLIASGFFLAHVLSRGRAMGLADTPIAFALSLLVAPYAVAGLLFSFWLGAAWGIGVLVLRRGGPKMGIEVPFAPFLALGYLLAYFLQWNPLVF